MIMRPGRIGGGARFSCRKLRAQFGGHAYRPTRCRADWTPERARLREQLAIALTPDLGEPFKREPSGFADPGAQHDSVAKRGGSFVVDFMSQNDPADTLLCVRISNGPPMRRGNILDPPQINRVVYVILLVDITGQN